MKRIMYLFLGIIAFSLVGCNDKEELGFEWDSVSLPIRLEIVDGENKNLLDAEMEGNIRDNAIKAYYKGNVYAVNDLTKVSYKGGFYMDETYLYCHYLRNESGSNVVIDWDNGRKDTIEFKYVDNRGWVFFLNGDEAEAKDPKYPNWITVIME